MKISSLLAIAAATLLLQGNALAQEESQSSNESTINQSEVKPAQSERKDIDDEITNKKLRAELGSKSKWSIRTALSYSGGSVERPMDKVRPNYRDSAATEVDVRSVASVALKYRVTDRDSIGLGTGLKVKKPFHGSMEDATSRSRNFSVSNPYIDYTRPYRVNDIQMYTTAILTGYTSAFDVDVVGGRGDVTLVQVMMKEFGKLSAGLTLQATGFVYSDSEQTYLDRGVRSPRPDVMLGAFPVAEYSFTDRLSARTVFGYFSYDKLRTSPNFEAGVPYQSLGLGVSITRDVYLYPNVQFVPNDIRAERTNVALSANINIL